MIQSKLSGFISQQGSVNCWKLCGFISPQSCKHVFVWVTCTVSPTWIQLKSQCKLSTWTAGNVPNILSYVGRKVCVSLLLPRLKEVMLIQQQQAPVTQRVRRKRSGWGRTMGTRPHSGYKHRHPSNTGRLPYLHKDKMYKERWGTWKMVHHWSVCAIPVRYWSSGQSSQQHSNHEESLAIGHPVCPSTHWLTHRNITPTKYLFIDLLGTLHSILVQALCISWRKSFLWLLKCKELSWECDCDFTSLGLQQCYAQEVALSGLNWIKQVLDTSHGGPL